MSTDQFLDLVKNGNTLNNGKPDIFFFDIEEFDMGGSSKVQDPQKRKLSAYNDELKGKDVRADRYSLNQYVERKSMLDLIYEDSSIAQSSFKGIVRLVLLVTFIYVVNNYTLKFYMNHELISQAKRTIFKEQMYIGFAFWAFLHFFTYISFFIQKLILKGFPFIIAYTIEFVCEQFVFVGVPYLIYQDEELYATTRVYMYFQIVVHYFKMNSYFKMNRIYREEYFKELVDTPKQGVKKHSTYPENVNFKDFTMYLLHPTFCYQDGYAINNEFKIGVFFVRVLLVVFGSWLPLYDIFADKINKFEIFPYFYLPTMSIYFIGSFVAFDFACNLYADLSGFADRQFYQDYWNCKNFDQYARKWNRLVHEFLYRHFYLEYMKRYRLTLFQANLITFVFSIVFHEAFFIVVFKQVSFYLTSLQLSQLVQLFLLRLFDQTVFGNLIFWFGQFFAVTSVCVNYSYDYGNFKYNPGG
eukprot:403367139